MNEFESDFIDDFQQEPQNDDELQSDFDRRYVDDFRREFETWDEPQLQYALTMIQDIINHKQQETFEMKLQRQQELNLEYAYSAYKQLVTEDEIYARVGLNKMSKDEFKQLYSATSDWRGALKTLGWDKHLEWLITHNITI